MIGINDALVRDLRFTSMYMYQRFSFSTLSTFFFKPPKVQAILLHIQCALPETFCGNFAETICSSC